MRGSSAASSSSSGLGAREPGATSELHPAAFAAHCHGRVMSLRSYHGWMLKNRGYEDDTFSAKSAFAGLLQRAAMAPEGPRRLAPELLAAISNDDDAVVISHLSRGVPVHYKNNMGVTLLHRACRLGSARVVRALLDRGADPRLCDDDGKTVLHDACWSSKPNFAAVRLVIDRCEALSRSRDKFGATPLDYVPPPAVAEWMAFLHAQLDVWWPRPPLPHQAAGQCPYVAQARAAEAPAPGRLASSRQHYRSAGGSGTDSAATASTSPDEASRSTSPTAPSPAAASAAARAGGGPMASVWGRGAAAAASVASSAPVSAATMEAAHDCPRAESSTGFAGPDGSSSSSSSNSSSRCRRCC
mmetsp:Transcript_24468/g.92431  ORF Transcript_24468/g.92431 Transcript_24468/m.92431 type:complete len:357 (-) Transcript_24468:516-1586(-)